LSATGDGTGVVAHAGSVGLRLLADRNGLTGEMSKVPARPLAYTTVMNGQVMNGQATVMAHFGCSAGLRSTV
jgi:hypothetical protein